MRQFLFRIKNGFKDIFAYPTARIEEASGDYDAYWRDKRGRGIGALSPWQKKRAELLLAQLPQGALSIADIGCGDGSVLRYVMERRPLERAVGVDVSSFALAKAAEFGIETIQGDINTIESLRGVPAVDYVLLFEILEHVQDSELLLKEMLGKARRGVFFSFPNTGYFVYRLRLLFGKFPLQWRVHPREHLRFWTYKDLRWWLKALGYRHYHIRTYEGVPLLKHLWPSMFAAGFFVYLSTHEDHLPQ